MSAERLQKQIYVEKAQLRNLLQTHHPLLTGGGGSCPNPVELSALAAMLHSFYTGIENILKRIAVELDGGAPTGEIWHRRLLDSMTTAITSQALLAQAGAPVHPGAFTPSPTLKRYRMGVAGGMA